MIGTRIQIKAGLAPAFFLYGEPQTAEDAEDAEEIQDKNRTAKTPSRQEEQ